MAKCAPCTQADLDGMSFGETLQCGNYSAGGTYLGTTRVTKVTNGWLYNRTTLVTNPVLELCNDPLDVSGGLGE